MLQIDPAYEPGPVETREVFGITFAQQRNDAVPRPDDLTRYRHRQQASCRTTRAARLDRGPDRAQVHAVQLRLLCPQRPDHRHWRRAAVAHPLHAAGGQQGGRLVPAPASRACLNLPFRAGIKRPERDNAIDQFLLDELTPAEEAYWLKSFSEAPVRLRAPKNGTWLEQFSGAALGSDAFFPFRDSIDRAAQSGVQLCRPAGRLRAG